MARKFWAVGSMMLSASVVACGDDTGGSGGAGGQSGSGGNASASETVTDAASTADAESSASSVAASSSSTGGDFVCDHEGYVPENEFAVQFDPDSAFYSGGQYPDDETYNSLDIEWYDGRLTVGEAEIIGANYNTCTLCVLIYVGCLVDSEELDCAQTFLASAGSVVIDSAEGDLVGSLHDVELVEVTIDEDLFSDPVPNGETWCIDEYSFDVPLDPVEE